MTKERKEKSGKKQKPQLSFRLASTSGTPIRALPPGGLDKRGNTRYTKTTMTTKKQRTVQLKHADDALWLQVKALAIIKGQTMTEWIELVIRKELAQIKKSEKEAE